MCRIQESGLIAVTSNHPHGLASLINASQKLNFSPPGYLTALCYTQLDRMHVGCIGRKLDCVAQKQVKFHENDAFVTQVIHPDYPYTANLEKSNWAAAQYYLLPSNLSTLSTLG